MISGTLMYQDDDPDLPVGAVRAWKVGFGYTTKGTVVTVYVVVTGGASTHVSEIATLPDGSADVDAIAAVLRSRGVEITAAVRDLLGE